MEKMLPLIITLILGIASFVWTAYSYFDTKEREQNLKEFDNYHKLIKELVQPEKMDDNYMFVDRQTAIIYEFRHFKRYYEFSYRTLLGLKQKWEKVPNQFPRLLEECDETLKFLKIKIKRYE